MFCAKCGASLKDDARQCHKCGAPVRIRPAAPKGEGGFSGLSDSEEELFRDPVYYEDVTDELDVGEILRIVRGGDGDAQEGPETGEELSAEAEGGDFDSEDLYGEDSYDLDDLPLPLMERVRRRLAGSQHARAEKAEERAMARHLARAEKYFNRQESMADRIREERARKAEDLRLKRIRLDEEWHEQKWFEEALRRELEEEQAALRAREARLKEEESRRREREEERTALRAGEARFEEESLQKLRAERARRRAREDAQDGFDRALGKYGLTKEVAVRLATLALIAVLSVIYVLGRGGSKADAGSLPASGMTAVPALAEPDAEGGLTEEENSLPTGGGDFQNTQ